MNFAFDKCWEFFWGGLLDICRYLVSSRIRSTAYNRARIQRMVLANERITFVNSNRDKRMSCFKFSLDLSIILHILFLVFMIFNRLSLWRNRSSCFGQNDWRLHQSRRRWEVLSSCRENSDCFLVHFPFDTSFALKLFVQVYFSWQSHEVQISNRFSYIVWDIHLICLVDFKTEVILVGRFSSFSVFVYHLHMQLHYSLIDLITETLTYDCWVLMAFLKHRVLKCRHALFHLAWI